MDRVPLELLEKKRKINMWVSPGVCDRKKHEGTLRRRCLSSWAVSLGAPGPQTGCRPTLCPGSLLPCPSTLCTLQVLYVSSTRDHFCLTRASSSLPQMPATTRACVETLVSCYMDSFGLGSPTWLGGVFCLPLISRGLRWWALPLDSPALAMVRRQTQKARM